MKMDVEKTVIVSGTCDTCTNTFALQAKTTRDAINALIASGWRILRHRSAETETTCRECVAREMDAKAARKGALAQIAAEKREALQAFRDARQKLLNAE